MDIALDDLKKSEAWNTRWLELQNALEQELCLPDYTESIPNMQRTRNQGRLLRLCLSVGLSLPGERSVDNLASVPLSGTHFHRNTLLNESQGQRIFTALLKIRYHKCDVNWLQQTTVSRLLALEVMRGFDYLMHEGNLREVLLTSYSSAAATSDIPPLDLKIGIYDGSEQAATLSLNSKQVSNAQMLVAGATGSGKTNLLCLLIRELRSASADTPYPVNFLLFDYKGEFSDPKNTPWLQEFQVGREAVLNPNEAPLPFTPFKTFDRAEGNEINGYATSLSSAFCSIYGMKAGAKQSTRLTDAIIACYKTSKGAPITFTALLSAYRQHMENAEAEDQLSSALKEMERCHFFADSDRLDPITNSLIINLGGFPKDGPVAKAIVYFVISKLNNLYDTLPPQADNGKHVQLRHFTIIDEAHYMLDFSNEPLKRLLSVGRNKGLSIILATQSFGDFRSKHIDFLANAQYPLIMKQQTLDDKAIKDLFGVSGKQFNEVKAAISGLAKGQLIMKEDIDLGGVLALKPYKRVIVDRFL